MSWRNIVFFCSYFCFQFASSRSVLTNCGTVAECSFENDLCGYNNTINEWQRANGTYLAKGPTSGNTGKYYMYWDDLSFADLDSEKFDGSEGQINFAYQLYGSSFMGALYMSTYGYDGLWTDHFFKSGNQGSGWKYANYSATNFSYVRFTAVAGFGTYQEIAIDDVSVRLPDCLPTISPTLSPTGRTQDPTLTPTLSLLPTISPSPLPSIFPTYAPTITHEPTPLPTSSPTSSPTNVPTMQCIAGQYFSDSECIDCPIGKYSNNTHPPYTECSPCDAGFYVSSRGNNKCSACATGKLSNPSRTAW